MNSDSDGMNSAQIMLAVLAIVLAGWYATYYEGRQIPRHIFNALGQRIEYPHESPPGTYDKE